MIHISLSPNLETDDVWTALRRLFAPWQWNKGLHLEVLKYKFAEYFDKKNIYFFNSGRSALFLLLKSLKLAEGDEIIMQAFSCNAVANPILWAGGTPVYADIDETFNIDIEKLEKKITSNTRAIIIQNTFGIPARIDEILEIAKRHKLLVIEDCAHSLGAEYKGKKVGTFGDAAIFSFGRDKVISSVYGGAAILNNKKLLQNFEAKYKDIKYPNIFWTAQQLLHPPLTYISLITYQFGGKYFLRAMQKIKLLSFAVRTKERIGKRPAYFPARLPNALAALALNQFEKLNKLNAHRRELAKLYENNLKDKDGIYIVENYDEGSIFLRYPIMHKDSRIIQQDAKERRMILGDWYKEIIAPSGTNLENIKYKMGENKNAESVALSILNLPTNIRTSKMEAQEVASFIKAYRWKKKFIADQ